MNGRALRGHVGGVKRDSLGTGFNPWRGRHKADNCTLPVAGKAKGARLLSWNPERPVSTVLVRLSQVRPGCGVPPSPREFANVLSIGLAPRMLMACYHLPTVSVLISGCSRTSHKVNTAESPWEGGDSLLWINMLIFCGQIVDNRPDRARPAPHLRIACLAHTARQLRL